MLKKIAKMLPKRSAHKDRQNELFRQELSEMLKGIEHPLLLVGEEIDWGSFEKSLRTKFGRMGRRALPVRLVIGVMYLQYMYNLSDREIVERWKENPYYQMFCGQKYFEYKAPFDSSSLEVAIKERGREVVRRNNKSWITNKSYKKKRIKKSSS